MKMGGENPWGMSHIKSQEQNTQFLALLINPLEYIWGIHKANAMGPEPVDYIGIVQSAYDAALLIRREDNAAGANQPDWKVTLEKFIGLQIKERGEGHLGEYMRS